MKTNIRYWSTQGKVRNDDMTLDSSVSPNRIKYFGILAIQRQK